MGDLKELQQKQKLSTEEINDFTLKHSEGAASVIKNASGSEMYREFCSCFENFAKCFPITGSASNNPTHRIKPAITNIHSNIFFSPNYFEMKGI